MRSPEVCPNEEGLYDDTIIADENAEKVLAFTKAIYKAMDYGAVEHHDEVAQYVANQTKTDYDSVYNQRGDADWLTGKEVAAGAAEATPVEDYVLLQNMIDAAK